MTPKSDIAHAEIILAAEELGLVCCWSEPINVGDMYLAKRNGPVQLLTAKEVHPGGWVYPVEAAYAFDIWECCKVIIRDDSEMAHKDVLYSDEARREVERIAAEGLLEAMRSIRIQDNRSEPTRAASSTPPICRRRSEVCC